MAIKESQELGQGTISVTALLQPRHVLEKKVLRLESVYEASKLVQEGSTVVAVMPVPVLFREWLTRCTGGKKERKGARDPNKVVEVFGLDVPDVAFEKTGFGEVQSKRASRVTVEIETADDLDARAS